MPYRYISCDKLAETRFDYDIIPCLKITDYLLDLLDNYENTNVRIDLSINFHDVVFHALHKEYNRMQKTNKLNEEDLVSKCKQTLQTMLKQNVDKIAEFYEKRQQKKVTTKISMRVQNNMSSSSHYKLHSMRQNMSIDYFAIEEQHKTYNDILASLYPVFVQYMDVLSYFLDDAGNMQGDRFYLFEYKQVDVDQECNKAIQDAKKLHDQMLFRQILDTKQNQLE